MALVLDSDLILDTVSPSDAVELVSEAYRLARAGEWEMPPKVYVDAPPHGDFRAMPARGSGYACLKWVTSFPGNPARGLPVVTGALLLSSASTGELLAILDCAAATSLRTGAAAAVSARALAADGARTVGIIGCGVNGSWAARCLDACGYGPGICADTREESARRLAAELSWEVGDRERAAACEIVVTVTPGSEPVIGPGELRAGSHVAALGADAAGKAEVAAAELARCSLFCDEWAQASKGGELSGPVAAGALSRSEVVELGEVLAGRHPGRRSDAEITLFDSTGLATQDLAIAIAAYETVRDRKARVPEIRLGGA